MSFRSAGELARAAARGESLTYLFFWGHRPKKKHTIGPSCLSQWWACDFTIDGQAYPSAEHFMMAEKARLFGDAGARARILAAPDPGKAKALGRLVTPFDEARWSAARFDIVLRGSLAKFGQNDPLRYFLLGTRDAILVEASPTDRVWGIGLAADHPDARNPGGWPGENLLGFALMQARETLRAEVTGP